MIHVAGLAGHSRKTYSRSKIPIAPGNTLARVEWSKYKAMISWTSLIFAAVEIGFIIIILFFISSLFQQTNRDFGDKSLGGFFMFCLIVIRIGWIYINGWRMPHYRFEVYENGFTYAYKLPGTAFSSNYIPYDDIRSVYFQKYGMRMVLVLDKNRHATIEILPYSLFPFHSSGDYKVYITLMQKFKTLFHFDAFPDIQAIVNYVEALNQEASPESFYNEAICNRNLKSANHQFV